MMIIIEAADIATRRRAGAAALAKNASSVAEKMLVAKVLNPVGAKRRVAGSSFIVEMNTSAAPVSTPERIIGTVT